MPDLEQPQTDADSEHPSADDRDPFADIAEPQADAPVDPEWQAWHDGELSALGRLADTALVVAFVTLIGTGLTIGQPWLSDDALAEGSAPVLLGYLTALVIAGAGLTAFVMLARLFGRRAETPGRATGAFLSYQIWLGAGAVAGLCLGLILFGLTSIITGNIARAFTSLQPEEFSQPLRITLTAISAIPGVLLLAFVTIRARAKARLLFESILLARVPYIAENTNTGEDVQTSVRDKTQSEPEA